MRRKTTFIYLPLYEITLFEGETNGISIIFFPTFISIMKITKLKVGINFRMDTNAYRKNIVTARNQIEIRSIFLI
jgi:hypothetical protein